MTDKVDTSKLRRLAKAATRGPWAAAAEIDGARAGQMTVVRTEAKLGYGAPGRIVTVGQTRPHQSGAAAEANVELIAEMDPETVLKICDELDKLREWQRKVCDEYGYDADEDGNPEEVLEYLPVWRGMDAGRDYRLEIAEAQVSQVKAVVERGPFLTRWIDGSKLVDVTDVQAALELRGDPPPLPGDGPEYHADKAFWDSRNTGRAVEKEHADQLIAALVADGHLETDTQDFFVDPDDGTKYPWNSSTRSKHVKTFTRVATPWKEASDV